MKIANTFWAGVGACGGLVWSGILMEWVGINGWVGFGVLFVSLLILAAMVKDDAPLAGQSVTEQQIGDATQALWREDVWGSGLNRYEDMALIAFRAADISVNSKRDRRL